MAFHFYGNWGGLGWSDGHYTEPGEQINWDGDYKDVVDRTFRDHDQAYDNATRTYDAPEKSNADKREYWEALIVADSAVNARLLELLNSGTLTDEQTGAATAAMDLFSVKNLYWNYPSFFLAHAPEKLYPGDVRKSGRKSGSDYDLPKLRHQGQPVDGIWFGHTDPLPARVKLAFRLDADEWQGLRRVRFLVEDAETPV